MNYDMPVTAEMLDALGPVFLHLSSGDDFQMHMGGNVARALRDIAFDDEAQMAFDALLKHSTLQTNGTVDQALLGGLSSLCMANLAAEIALANGDSLWGLTAQGRAFAKLIG